MKDYQNIFFFFFFQAEDGIRDLYVTGVQTCALPISNSRSVCRTDRRGPRLRRQESRPRRDSNQNRLRKRLSQQKSLFLSAARGLRKIWVLIFPIRHRREDRFLPEADSKLRGSHCREED